MKRIYLIAVLALLVVGANRYLYGSNTVDPSDEPFSTNEATIKNADNAFVRTDTDATDGSIGFQVGAKAHAEDGQTKTVKKSGSFDFTVSKEKTLNLNIFIDGRLGGTGDYTSWIKVHVFVIDSSGTVIEYNYKKTKPDNTTTGNEPVVESHAFTAKRNEDYTFNFELELYAKANDDDSRATANFMNANLFTVGETTNQPPVAIAKADKTAEVDKPVEFDGSGSYDPEGGSLVYEWDFGDGEGSSGEKTTHTYSSLGTTYTVTLTVTDNDNLTSIDTLTITVKDEINDDNDDDDSDDDDDDDSDDDDSDDDDDDDSDDDDDDDDSDDDDDD
ncbi:MAG: PKD domain-containing protein [Desulfobacterales bacterium]